MEMWMRSHLFELFLMYFCGDHVRPSMCLQFGGFVLFLPCVVN